MKPFKRIVMLSGVVFCIIIFWLMPGINKAKDTHYTRRYEDVDARDSLKAGSKSAEKKLYKKERIHSRAGIREIHPKMFSRAIHFEEETKAEKLYVDSVQQAHTAKVIQ